MFDVHPLVRLISFIVFAAFVALGETESSVIGFVFLLLVWLLSAQLPSTKAWLMIKRLKIFFISILIMYLWFTPGQLLWPPLDHWSPTYEGLYQGLQRIVALILMVLGVEALLRLTNRSDLLVGLYYLATPFQWLGVRREQFIIRVLLTMEAVQPKEKPQANYYFSWRKFPEYLDRVAQGLADRFNQVSEQELKFHPVEIEIKSPPGWLQWLIPISMTLLFLNAGGSGW